MAPDPPSSDNKIRLEFQPNGSTEWYPVDRSRLSERNSREVILPKNVDIRCYVVNGKWNAWIDSEPSAVSNSAIGDETVASQEPKSTKPATLIERATAMVDALFSGEATDWLQVRLFGENPSGTPVEVDAAPLDTAANATDKGILTYLARSLRAIGEDTILATPRLTNGTSYGEVQRNGSDLRTAVHQWNAGTLSTSIEQWNAGVLNVTQDVGPYTDRVTSTGTYAQANPGNQGQNVTIVADTNGSATLSVGVSRQANTWDTYTLDIPDAGGLKETVSGFPHVRASVNQNLNSLVVSAKGI